MTRLERGGRRPRCGMRLLLVSGFSVSEVSDFSIQASDVYYYAVCTVLSRYVAQFTAITVCCCVIATFLLLVLFLRCRSCFRRRRHNQKQKFQRFWYCIECSKLGSVEPRRFGFRRWPATNPSIFSSWSEGIPLPDKPGPNLSIPYVLQHSNGNLCPQHCCSPRAILPRKQDGTLHNQSQVNSNQHDHHRDQRQRQQQLRTGSNFVCTEAQIQPSKELDNTQPICLAGGYAEFYRRQGKLQSPGLERRLQGRQPESRAP
ncbi:hypothetical protein FBUS_04577 [Fasciolopsis buskii]|uniref:Uncharacterized protein n=1 Tax=Fasciolopsis buskii TaxID=27845 RepID=A0A8E0VE27_9TREM|nr:hypothetical protein FBUS_04577 [Fasciolopsis buski]